MAFPIPSFLQFAPPEAAISDLGNLREKALAREQSKEINLAELGLRRQDINNRAQAQAAEQAGRADELAFRQFSLQQNMTTDMAKLAQQKSIADEEAKMAMIQFQGTQNLQRDIANGMKPDEAVLRNIPMIAAGNPAALAGFFNTLQRTKTQADMAADRNQIKLDIAEGVQSGLNNRFGIKEQNDIDQAELDRQAKLQAAMIKAQNVTKRLSQPMNAKMMNELADLTFDYRSTSAQKESKRDSIIQKYEDMIGNDADNSNTSTPKSTERVPVLNPSGKRVTIPSSQLDDALKQGYKRIP